MTLPLLMPIFVYCLITAMIGGIQMFDVPQVLTNYGMSGAISVIIFIITGILGGIVYKFLSAQYKDPVEKPRRARKGARK